MQTYPIAAKNGGRFCMERPFTPYEGQEPYIFVDYSHQDSSKVLPILTELDRQGYRFGLYQRPRQRGYGRYSD